MSRKMRFWLMLTLLLGVVGLTLGSVLAQEGMSTIIIGTTDEPSGLDSGYAYAVHDWEILKNTGTALMSYEPGTANLIPGLATDYEVSEDGLVYTFTLRKGVLFADGTPLTAKIVADSIMRGKTLDGDISGFVNGFVASVEAVDDLTVKITLTQAYAYFPAVAATAPFVPMNPNQFPVDALNNTPSRIDGVGPYMMVSYTPGEQMVLERNPNYWDTEHAPHIDRVIIRYFADPTTLALAVENGEVDIAWRTVGPVEAARLETVKGLNVIKIDAPASRYISLNHAMAPHDNPLVNQAIAAAIDREAINDRVFEGRNTTSYSMVPEGVPYAAETFLDKFGIRDLDMAIDLLTQAGYSADKPLELTFWWPPEHYGTTTADLVQVIKEQLEETGLIKVTLQSQSWGTYIAAATDGEYPMFILGWFPDFVDPATWLDPWGTCAQSPSLGINYCSEEMDSYLIEAGTTTDPAKREELYKKAQELWTVDVPTIPLYLEPEYITAREGVGGIKIGPPFEFLYQELTKAM